MKLNLLVIRTRKLYKLKTQYELLGLKFEYHRHEKGVFHYSSQIEEVIFEIYPTKSESQVNSFTRLGFAVKDLPHKIDELQHSSWIIIQELQETSWEQVAIIQDLDGRKVELKAIEL